MKLIEDVEQYIANIKPKITSDDLKRLKLYKERVIDTCNIENKKLKKVLTSKDIEHWQYSGYYNRYYTMCELTNAKIDTVNTITAVYKLKNVKLNKDIIYNISYISYPEINVQYICPSGSMISRDGEYRGGLIKWDLINERIQNTKLKNIVNYLERNLQFLLQERELELTINYLYPNKEFKKHDKIIRKLSKQYEFTIFAIAWFIFQYNSYFGLMSGNINQQFKNMLGVYERDVDLFVGLWQKFSGFDVEYLYYIVNNNNIEMYKKSKLGQKIVPMSLVDAQNFFKITHSIWKEFFMSMRASNLITNNVTNGFPLFNTWFLIKNDGQVFDSRYQKDKFEVSEKAKKIAEFLYRAGLCARKNIKEIDKLIETAIEETSEVEAISEVPVARYEFQHLNNLINETIQYTNKNIIMSDVALCLVSEYIGRTTYDSLFLQTKSPYYTKLLSNIFSKAEYPNFRKYMFQLCYNLYCINSKIGIIHGDLHTNNMTFNPIIYKKNITTPSNAKVMYILDEKNQYIFNNNFYDLCIIDFSRIIVNHKNKILEKITDIPKEYYKSKPSEDFINQQVDNLIDYAAHYKPEYRELLKSRAHTIKYNYELFFKILSAVDVYSALSKIFRFLQITKWEINLSTEASNLMRSIFEIADNYITKILLNVLNDKNYDKYSDLEWPNLAILKTIFEKEHINNISESDYESIYDIYNFENKEEYNLSTSDKFPPELDITTERKEFEKRKNINYNIINLIAKRQTEKNV